MTSINLNPKRVVCSDNSGRITRTINLNPRKLIWVTDIHLNFLSLESRVEFYTLIKKQKPDYVLITGDISEADVLNKHLVEMYASVKRPIYFVLGNHDYYNGSWEEVDLNAKAAFSRDQERGVYYLPTNPQEITTTALIGINNWYDCKSGRIGFVGLNDWNYIKEYLGTKNMAEICKVSLQRCKAAIKDLQNQIESIAASTTVNRIIIAMHVPPFKQLSMFEGKRSSPYYLPFFSSATTGRALKKLAKAYPHITFDVYCGHTHSKAEYHPLKNLHCYCGASEYGAPSIAGIIEV